MVSLYRTNRADKDKIFCNKKVSLRAFQGMAFENKDETSKETGAKPQSLGFCSCKGNCLGSLKLS